MVLTLSQKSVSAEGNVDESGYSRFGLEFLFFRTSGIALEAILLSMMVQTDYVVQVNLADEFAFYNYPMTITVLMVCRVPDTF